MERERQIILLCFASLCLVTPPVCFFFGCNFGLLIYYCTKQDRRKEKIRKDFFLRLRLVPFTSSLCSRSRRYLLSQLLLRIILIRDTSPGYREPIYCMARSFTSILFNLIIKPPGFFGSRPEYKKILVYSTVQYSTVAPSNKFSTSKSSLRTINQSQKQVFIHLKV